jgi:dTDP-4-dehydrorhamnose reductase
MKESKKRILITGAGGQLGREFVKSLRDSPYEASAAGREECDISDPDSVKRSFSDIRPHIVINCAAYNLVDAAERDSESAFRANAAGVKNLAAECARHGVFLVHYSSDYVFDGRKEDFYVETDVPSPLSEYGRSKLRGEEHLREEMSSYLLFRVSWVFGAGQQNFLRKLQEWAGKNRVLKVVCDQISVPTSTRDIAHLTLFALNRGLKGLYHLTAGGYASRYEVARYFLGRLDAGNLILPVQSGCFPSAAQRPYFSAMSNTRLSEALNVEIPHWHRGIDNYIETTSMKEESK